MICSHDMLSLQGAGFDSLMLNDFKMIKGKCRCRVYQ